MKDFIFLNKKACIKKPIELIKKTGTKAIITDFAYLNCEEPNDEIYFNIDQALPQNKTGSYWLRGMKDELKFDSDVEFLAIIKSDGKETYRACYNESISARPAKIFETKEEILKKFKDFKLNNNGVFEAYYGYYPQQAPSEKIQYELEKLYLKGVLSKTGNHYTMIAKDNILKLTEYKYGDKEYVRVIPNPYEEDEKYLLSNGVYYDVSSSIWIEVQPIKWLIDKESKTVLSEKLLFTRTYDKEYGYDFRQSDIKKYLDDYFSKEIMQPRKIHSLKEEQPIKHYTKANEKIVIKDNTKIEEKIRPYRFNFNMLTEEDILKGMIESNIPVFLHGKSGDGKSARVKQLDPDCQIIYMRNATLDSINGKSVYNSETGEMIDIPPTWYIKLKEKCEKEPDKIHILFFDELTNATKSIQGMALNIVLDKEVNGKWNLPENTRIVAAGNEREESSIAETLTEPLFNRFAHVYIDTTLSDWLKWATTDEETYERLDYKKEDQKYKIHPLIYAFIMYKLNILENVLRTEYNGKEPNADPRKWEMASKVLYKTKQPEMLRSLIGEKLTNEFIEFANTKPLTISTASNSHENNDSSSNMLARCFITAVSLSEVEEQYYENAKELINNLSEKSFEVFETLWNYNHFEKPQEKIKTSSKKTQSFRLLTKSI